MSAASPVSASMNGTTASAACNASARELLKPSPYRKRTKPSTNSRTTPTLRTRCQASSASSSSPSISVVTGTVRAVVMVGHDARPAVIWHVGRVRHTDWLLTASERANAQTSWTTGTPTTRPGPRATSSGR